MKNKKKTESKIQSPARAPQTGGLSIPPMATVALADLNPAPYNPRIMPREAMRALKASLAKHGMVLNIVVQRRSPEHGSNIIVGGHQRLTAMRELCAEKGWPVPTEIQVVMLDIDDATAKQLNVSLNNIQGEFDPYKLGELFLGVRDAMSLEDVMATGFTEENINALLREVDPSLKQAEDLESGVGELGSFANSITLSIEFSSAERRDEAKELLKAMAGERKEKAGDAMLVAVKAASAARKKKAAA